MKIPLVTRVMAAVDVSSPEGIYQVSVFIHLVSSSSDLCGKLHPESHEESSCYSYICVQSFQRVIIAVFLS